MSVDAKRNQRSRAHPNNRKKVTRGRPPFSFYLIDLPSDHEVDEGLSTECEVIRAILSNRGFRSLTKSAQVTSRARFNKYQWRAHSKVGFVHLAAHGSRSGIGLIGGDINWNDLAEKLKIIAPKLLKTNQRVLSISCCHSRSGYFALKPLLKGYFTGCYYFINTEILFSDAMTTWAMFYRRKTIERPHGAVVDRINKSFGKDIIQFGDI